MVLVFGKGLLKIYHDWAQERVVRKAKTRPDEIIDQILKDFATLAKQRDDLLGQRDAFISEVIETREKNGEKPVAFVYKNSDTEDIKLVKLEQTEEFLCELADSIERGEKPDIRALWQDGNRIALIIEGEPGF